MGVATAVLVLQDGQLDVHGFDERHVFVAQWKYVPAGWPLKLNLLDFLHFVEAISSADADELGSIAFISLKV